MYSESRKNIPKTVVPETKPMTFDPVSVRRLKMESGTSGERERSSMARNAMERSAQPTKERITSAEAQPIVVTSGEPVDEEHQAGGHGHRARTRRSALHALCVTLADDSRHQEERGDADRDVDEEDPLPARVLR